MDITLIKNKVEEWASACSLTDQDKDHLMNMLVMHSDCQEYNRRIFLTTYANMEEILSEYNETDEYRLPMHGMTLYMSDGELESVIDEFDPKYIVDAGENSQFNTIGYIQGGNVIYDYRSAHPDTPKKFIGTPPVAIKLNDDLMFIRQAEVCGNLSVYLVRDCYLALLLSVSLGYSSTVSAKSPVLVYTILSKYYGFELSK